MKRWPNSRAWISIVYFIPNILGSALILALPSSNQVGQLISLYITGVGTVRFPCLRFTLLSISSRTDLSVLRADWFRSESRLDLLRYDRTYQEGDDQRNLVRPSLLHIRLSFSSSDANRLVLPA
jgi:hypothetical protein